MTDHDTPQPELEEVLARGDAERERLLALDPDGAVAKLFGIGVDDEPDGSVEHVVPDAPTIGELADPEGTLEETVAELAAAPTMAGPLLLELTCDPAAELGYYELPDGTIASRVHIDASARPEELEPFLLALGEPFTLAGRTADASVPAELAETWARRYARARRVEEQ